MVQAEAKYYPHLGAPGFQEVQQRRQIKRTYKKVNQGRKIMIIGGLFLFLYALLLVFLCIKSATLSYQINSLQTEISQLETSQNRMEYQISQAQSLDRIQQLAETQLGMTKPVHTNDVVMETHNKPVVLADNSNKSQSVSQSPLEKIYSNLSRLAQKSNE